MRIIQQGDVGLKEVKNIDEAKLKKIDYNKKKYNILAFGEHSGHAHCLLEKDTELFKDNDGTTFLKINNTTDLMHQKLDGTSCVEAHKPITIEPGVFQIGIVKEYDYFTGEARNVSD